VSITAAGMSPLEITVAAGRRVMFVNNDSRPHDIAGGKDPSTPECPESTLVGFITPGRSAETGVLTRPQTCEYHDHTMMGVPAFQGRIIIR
jgi:plastocyanin